MRLRSPFTHDWRPRERRDPDVISLDDYQYPLTVRTWRKVNATLALVRSGGPGFTYQASANAIGTLVALAIAYLVGIAGGLVSAVPSAVIASVGLLGVTAVAALLRLAPKQLLRARATELLDAEPARIVDSMKKIFATPRYPATVDVDDADAEWAILDGLWALPERERTIIAVRFGGSMTLEAIGDGLGLSRERVRQLESQAIARVAAYAENRQKAQPYGVEAED
jgi:RNA polymerase sigma factor (sigma-70 family)